MTFLNVEIAEITYAKPKPNNGIKFARTASGNCTESANKDKKWPSAFVYEGRGLNVFIEVIFRDK